MTTKKAKGEAQAEPMSEAALPLASVSQAEADELGLDAEAMQGIAAAEAAQRARLKSEGVESITVPTGITVSPALRVTLNGCSYDLPIGISVKAPRSVVALARHRIDSALAQEAAARAKSNG